MQGEEEAQNIFYKPKTEEKQPDATWYKYINFIPFGAGVCANCISFRELFPSLGFFLQ